METMDIYISIDLKKNLRRVRQRIMRHAITIINVTLIILCNARSSIVNYYQ